MHVQIILMYSKVSVKRSVMQVIYHKILFLCINDVFVICYE